MNPIPLHGVPQPRDKGMREAFAGTFARSDDIGARRWAKVEGETVADLWGGYGGSMAMVEAMWSVMAS